MEKNYEDVTQHLFSVSWKEQKFGISIPGYTEFFPLVGNNKRLLKLTTLHLGNIDFEYRDISLVVATFYDF